MKVVKLSILVMVIVRQASATRGRSGSTATNYGSSLVNYGTGGTSLTTFGGGSSDNYGGGNSLISNGFSRPATSRGSSGGYGQNEVPQIYNFDYHLTDPQGNSHFHRAKADASGTVRGSYGYDDVQGLYRVVDYIADASGFRARIRTNEPGTDGKDNPADVQMTVEQPSFGIQNRYASVRRTGKKPGSGIRKASYVVSANDDYEVTNRATEDKDTYEKTA